MNLWKLVTVALVFVLSSCGGGGESSGDASLPFDITLREDNPNIPAEYLGVVKNNTRIYAQNPEGNKVAITTNGLNGIAIVELNGELLYIEDNGTEYFNSVFNSGENVSVNVDDHPFLQQCEFRGGYNSDIISVTEDLVFYLECTNISNPSAPFVSTLYSDAIDSIKLEWKASEDRDTASSEISYRIFWSQNEIDILNKTATSKVVGPNQLNTDISGLSSDVLYYVAIEAIDIDSNISELSEPYSIMTLATPNVFTGTPYHIIEFSDINVINSNAWDIPKTAFTSDPQLGDILVSQFDTSYEVRKIAAIITNIDSYEIQSTVTDVSEIFESYTINSNVGYQRKVVGLNTLAASTTKAMAAKIPFNLTSCEGTKVSGNLLTINPIFQPEPRVINNLVVNRLSKTITGSMELKLDLTLGLQIGVNSTEGKNIELTCELNGIESIPVPVAGGLVKVKLGIKEAVKLSLTIPFVEKHTLKVTNKLTSSVKLYKDEATDKWIPDGKFNLSDRTAEYKYEDGNFIKFKLAWVPSFEAKINMLVFDLLTASLNFNTYFVDGEIDAHLSEESVLENDLILDKLDMENYFNVNLGFKIDPFNIPGILKYEIPKFELYKSKPKEFYSLIKVCTNSNANKDNCTKTERQSNLVAQKEYQLSIDLLDGVFNKVDPKSIIWAVQPKNGYLKNIKVTANEDDKATATLVVYDKASYTVAASAYGKGLDLKDIGRQYVTFSVNGSCQYGLGHELPAGSEQYFEGPTIGYVFPRTWNVVDSNKDMREVCYFDDGYTDGSNMVTFYAGQRDGVNRIELSPSAYREDRYKNGMLSSSYFHSDDGNSTTKYSIIPDPRSNFNLSVVTYEKGSLASYPDEYSGDLEVIIDIDKLQYKEVQYFADGSERSTLISPLNTTLSFGLDSHIAQYTGPEGETIFSRIYYIDGHLQTLSDYELGILKICGWGVVDVDLFPSRGYEDQEPGDTYFCY